MERLAMSTCLFKVTYKYCIFFPIYSFFIENGFFFPMIHPSIHSSRIFPTLPLPPFLLLKKKASFQEATAKQNKDTRQDEGIHTKTEQVNRLYSCSRPCL